MSDIWKQVKYQKQLPYTVKDLNTSDSNEARRLIDAWRYETDTRSLSKYEKAREKAIDVITAHPISLPYYSRTILPESVPTYKPSILTRIYNWFINLNITY